MQLTVHLGHIHGVGALFVSLVIQKARPLWGRAFAVVS